MFFEKIHEVDFRLHMFLLKDAYENLCSYVLALANNIYRAEARHFAGYKPAPRVADKLQLICLYYTTPHIAAPP